MTATAPALQIRDYGQPDAEVVIELWQELLADNAPHNEPAASLASKVAMGDKLLLVAECDGQIIGSVMGGYDGHRGWVYSVAVKAAYQRQGVASALLGQLEARLVQCGCLKLNLQVRATNHAVVAFYESLGYAAEERISMGKRLY